MLAPTLALVLRHGGLGIHVRPRPAGARDVPAVRLPRSAVLRLERRAGARLPGGPCAGPRARACSPASGSGSCSRSHTGSRPRASSSTTVASTGFITGLYVVFTPLITLAAFGTRVPRGGMDRCRPRASRVCCSCSASRTDRSPATCSCSATRRRRRCRSPPWSVSRRATTRASSRSCRCCVTFAAFLVIAAATGQIELPDTAQAWYAIAVTGVFAGALGYLVAAWVQARTTAARAALVFTLEAPFAALFGVVLLSEHLGWMGWTGCAVMLAGIALAEPAAEHALRRRLLRLGSRSPAHRPDGP